MKKAILLCFALTFSAAVSATAVTLSVPGDYSTIQDAIDEANDGDVIIVYPGRYCENINFSGKAITVTSTNPDDLNIVEGTIIDANGAGSVVTFVNGEGPDSVLAGFTITGGYGTADTSIANFIYWGAGIYCNNASPTVKDNVIIGNYGPIKMEGDDPENWQLGYGGGIGCLQSSAIITRNIIKGNEAYAGAGIMVYVGDGRITDNLIYDNSAEIGGGVILLVGGRLINNTVVSNHATIAGNVYGGSEFLIVNNIISSGNAVESGGIYAENPDQYVIAYNNVWDNTGGNYGGLPDQMGLNGNISEGPLFVNPAGNDYHLQVDSPCINAGDPDFVPEPSETDIDGEDRVFAGRVDIGADEYVGYLPPVADAGPDQYFNEIQLVTLDGSGSFFYDANGIKIFQWTQTAGPSVELSDPAAEQPTFIPESEDEYLFELVVSDGLNSSQPDEVLIAVGNRAPIADASSDIVCQIPEQVYLDGTGSYDPDPWDELTYSWTQIEGPDVVLYDADTAMPYFDCDEPGLYEFELVVSDSFEDSLPSTVQVVTVEVTISQQDLNVGYSTGNYFHYPDVSGSRVVYGVGCCCDVTWAGKYKVLETDQVRSLSGYLIQPKIDGDILVWFKYGDGWGNPWYHEPSNCSVFVRNIATGAQKTLRKWSWSQSYGYPVVSGKKVVWLEHLGLDPNPRGSGEANNWWDTPYNVCGADITDWDNPTYFTIAENVGRHDPYPCHSYGSDFDDVIDISGNIVVWEGDGDIYGTDISDLDDIRVFTICSDPARQFDPAVSGNIVVWTDERNDGGDIYGADISDLEDIEVFEIVKESGTQLQSAIDGCVIAYVDGGLSGEIKVCCLTKRRSALEMPLSGSPFGCGPAMDGDIIVWQTDFYGKAEGMALEVAYSIADGPIENLTTGKRYDYIQDAISDAAPADEIEVRQGTYNENICFKGKNIILRSTDPDNSNIVAATIIDGSGSGAVVTFESAEDANCVLAGFTITGGNAERGGGIYCEGDSSPKITNCIITNNSAGYGGGMYNYSSSPTLTNCTFSDNSANYGGGMYNYSSSPTVTNCTFIGNTSGHNGGGMYNEWSSTPMLTNCTFSGNTARYGGGIYCEPPPPPPPYEVANGTTAENTDTGIYYDSGGDNIIITNCILWGNEAPDGPQIYLEPNIDASVSYSDVEGGWLGTGNIDADPCFVQWGYWDANGVWVDGDYHLLPDSPCIDAGDPDYVAGPNETDLDGKPRVIGGRIDMGAYEYANTAPVACIVGGNRIVEAEGPWGTRVTLDGSCSSDADSTPGTNDDIVSFDWYKVDACDPNFEDFLASGEIIDCNLPLGEHIIVLEVIDKAGAFDTNEVTIIVQDTTPPDFTLSVTPTMLWPANHKMVLIRPSWTVSDICDESPIVSLKSITMNEGDEEKGDGNTAGDIQIGDDGSISLRAERSGTGSGRIYTITYQAVDDSGNVAVARATVTVPHDQR